MNYYNTIAEGYETLHREEQLRKLHLIKENLGINTNETTKTNKTTKIIDVGCGPCWSSEFFPQVVGVDPAFNLLNPRLLVVQGTAERLPFRDSFFDVVLCVTAFHHFDAGKAVDEMKRVARRDAVFVITLLKKSSKFVSLRRLLEEQFTVVNVIDDEHDLIYSLKDNRQ